MDDQSLESEAPLAIHGGEKLRKTPFGPRWVFGDEDRSQLESVMARAPVAWRNGEKVREFVAGFEDLFGVRNAIATGSGTAAIHAAAGALDLSPGDEVITTPTTDIGTVIGLLQHNLTPVFADWAEGTFNTCPADVERRITDRTRAILVVHLFGFPCDMDAIQDIAKRYGLAVIEDCAQAHLAEYKGRKVGSIGDLACWSFGLKTLTTEQGGMVSARNPELAAKARGFLSKGSVKENGAWHPYSRLGTFAPMTDLQAAVGVAQIKRLEEATGRRERVAGAMDEAISEIKALTLPSRSSADRAVYYMYPYHLDESAAGVKIADFIAALRAEGISDAFGPYLKGVPLHRQRLFLRQDTYGGSGFPMTDEMGVVRVDYANMHLPRAEALLPSLGFFHMRNSFTQDDGRDIAAAIIKVSRGLGFGPSRPVPVQKSGSPPVAMSAPSSEPKALPHVVARADSAVSDLRHRAVDDLVSPTRNPGGAGEALVDLSTAEDAGPENARRLQVAFDGLAGIGGRIRLPAGRFPVSASIQLNRRRNLVIEGAGGNLLDGGTCLEFQVEQGVAGLDLRTTVHCRIEGVALVARGGGAALKVQCDEAGPDGTSSLSLSFSRCTFGAEKGTASVVLQDCAGVTFEHCWFRGPGEAVQLGSPMRPTAKSISNGLVNSIAFKACLFFAPSRVVRASCVNWSGCHFSAPRETVETMIDASDLHCSEASIMSLRDNFALEGGTTTWLSVGSTCVGLIVEANRLRGFAHPLKLQSVGSAIVRGNLFERCGSVQNLPAEGDERAVIFSANVEISTSGRMTV